MLVCDVGAGEGVNTIMDWNKSVDEIYLSIYISIYLSIDKIYLSTAPKLQMPPACKQSIKQKFVNAPKCTLLYYFASLYLFL